MKAAAFGFREITEAGPAVVIPAHPKKGATRDGNVPYGGGALLNEVDGNLSLWGSQAGIELHWCGKFRGSFDPVHFALDVCQVPDAVDRDGDPIITVVARTIGADEAEAQEDVLNRELMQLLTAIRDNPGASIKRLGDACAPRAGLPGWSISNTNRRINALIARGLAEKSLGKVVLTAKGGRFLGDERAIGHSARRRNGKSRISRHSASFRNAGGESGKNLTTCLGGLYNSMPFEAACRIDLDLGRATQHTHSRVCCVVCRPFRSLGEMKRRHALTNGSQPFPVGADHG